MRIRTVFTWALVAGIAGVWSVRPAPIAPADLLAADRSTGFPVSDDGRTLEHASPADSIITIDWKVLRELDHRRGTVGNTLRALNGRRVRLPGFIVPLDDFADTVKEFLLVPYFGACVHEPPPPPNQMIYATMKSGSTPMSWWKAVWLEGTLHITRYQSVYGVAGFRFTVERVVPYARPGV